MKKIIDDYEINSLCRIKEIIENAICDPIYNIDHAIIVNLYYEETYFGWLIGLNLKDSEEKDILIPMYSSKNIIIETLKLHFPGK